MLLGVGGHFLDLLRKLDKFLILNPRATWTGDDIHALAEVGYRDKTALLGILDNGETRGDFLVFPLIGQGQGHANRIAHTVGQKLFKSNPALDHAIRR